MANDSNALSWTSAQVLSDLRRKASLPVTSTDFSDAVLLREATDVLWSFAGWAIAQAGEGRLVASLDRSLVTATLAGPYRAASEVDLPPLAVADAIDSVSWIDATGTNQARLLRIDPAEESDYDTPGRTGSPQGYTLLGGRIRLYPQPTSGGTLRITYQRRHPELVVDQTAPTYTVGTVLSAAASAPNTALTLGVAWPSLVAGQEVDILAATQPYRVLAASANVVSNVGSVLTIAVPFASFSGLALTGARVVPAGQSPYVHFPLELRACVTEKLAANVLRVLGDLQGMQAAEQAALMELARVTQMLSPRTRRDRPRAINPHSHLRSKMARGGRW